MVKIITVQVYVSLHLKKCKECPLIMDKSSRVVTELVEATLAERLREKEAQKSLDRNLYLLTSDDVIEQNIEACSSLTTDEFAICVKIKNHIVTSKLINKVIISSLKDPHLLIKK